MVRTRLPALMVVALVFVGVLRLCQADSSEDTLTRVKKSTAPHSSLGSQSSFRRYRYPVYNKRMYNGEPDFEDTEKEGEVDEQFSGVSSDLPLSADREKKLSRLRIVMLPFDLDKITALYRNGRRKRTPQLYDLKRIYRIYEAGKKRSVAGYGAEEVEQDQGDDDEDERRKRGGDDMRDIWDLARISDIGKRSVAGYYDLLDMTKLARAGKRSRSGLYTLMDASQLAKASKRQSSYDLMSLSRLAQAGKRSPHDYDLATLSRLAEAGKRSPSDYDLLALSHLADVGKRSRKDLDLITLSRLAQAGKRTSSKYDLATLTRMVQVGKRSTDDQDSIHATGLATDGNGDTHDIDLLSNPNVHNPDQERAEAAEDDEGLPELTTPKKKRSFDDYFGWDRRKKASGNELLTDHYLNTMSQELESKTEKRGTADGMGVVMKRKE